VRLQGAEEIETNGSREGVWGIMGTEPPKKAGLSKRKGEERMVFNADGKRERSVLVRVERKTTNMEKKGERTKTINTVDSKRP